METKMGRSLFETIGFRLQWRPLFSVSIGDRFLIWSQSDTRVTDS